MNLWQRIYTERRSTILAVGGFLIANIAVLILAVLPLRQSVSDNETAANEARAKLAQAQLKNRQQKDTRVRRDQAQLELGKFYSTVLPKNYNTAVSLLNFQVRQAATDAGLVIADTSTTPMDERESKLTKISEHITLAGNYQNIRKFLYAVETAQEFVVVEKVELVEKASDLANPGPNSLSVGLDISTYYLRSGQ
jgi:Tfp pilus assembly protein PilO